MKSLESQVGEVLGRIDAESPQAIPRNQSMSAYGGECASLADCPDDERIRFTFDDFPSAIMVDTPEQVAEIFKQYYLQTQGEKAFKQKEAWTIGQATHETEHAKIMHAYGFKNTRYGICIEPNYSDASSSQSDTDIDVKIRDGYSAYAFTTPVDSIVVPKIGYAMILAYPTDPSVNDIHQVRQLGYQTASEVYERSQKVKGIPLLKPLCL